MQCCSRMGGLSSSAPVHTGGHLLNSLPQIMLVVHVYSEVLSFVGELTIAQWHFPNFKLCSGACCVATASITDHLGSPHLGAVEYTSHAITSCVITPYVITFYVINSYRIISTLLKSNLLYFNLV